jgi:hypothetical protein
MNDQKSLVAEETIERVIEAVPAREFTVIEFIEALRKESSRDLDLLLKKYGQFGEERNSQYTIKNYLSSRLLRHSQKPHSLLQKFTPYRIDREKDFRETTPKERLSHGGAVIAVWRKKRK